MKNNYFSTRFSYDPKRAKTWKIICRYLNRFIPENSIIVDIGAGYCDFINNINSKIKFAVDCYDEFKKYAAEEVKTYFGYSTDLNFFDRDFFDIVFSSNLLEHLTFEEIDRTLNEMIRVLKPGGKLILLLPNFKYCYKVFYDDYTHKTPLTDSSICDILKSKNMEILKVKPKFLPFSFKSKLPVCNLFVKIYLYSPIKPFAGQMLIIAKKR